MESLKYYGLKREEINQVFLTGSKKKVLTHASGLVDEVKKQYKNNNMRLAIADDGGAQISNDGGENWTTYFNQPTAQFYRVSTDNSFPYRIYGAQQDNSTIRINHRSASSSISESDWESTAGGVLGVTVC